jgi:tol-pal system protein YbgF
MLKARMQQLEESLAALRAKLFGSSGDNSDADPAYRAYGAGLEAIRSGDYAAAVEAFQQFLQQRPDDSYAAEAQYWMGEALFKERQYVSAIAAQKKLIADHPDSARTADALLVIGSAELGLGNVESAREAWETLINGHPNSEAAGKARKRLERIH